MSSLTSKYQIFALTVLVCIAFSFRVHRLNDVGLAEDEVHKILAVESYRSGVFNVNAEHPMLMKLAVTGTFVLADRWNQRVGPRLDLPSISDELAIRLPNVVIGSLTCVALFLLAKVLFGSLVGLISAALWAIGINAITYNRIAKEDTFLVFFLLLAFFCYGSAKQVNPRNLGIEAVWYATSGAAFGLAIASKYFPHYLGLIFLFHYLARVRGLDSRPHCRRTKQAFWSCFLVFFLAANPLLLSPGIWGYLVSYASGQAMTHHGYQVMGQLYHNEPAYGLYGTPIYFYFLYLLVKVPVSLLVLFLVGLASVWANRTTHLGSFFLLYMLFTWMLGYSLAGGKWLRYTLSLTPWLYMLAAVGTVWLGRRVAAALFNRPTRFAVAGCTLLVFSLGSSCMVVVNTTAAPYYSLFVNHLGGGMKKAGYYFPHDEFYDLGLREALAYVAQSSPHSSAVYSEADDLVAYYARRFRRPDLRADNLCQGDPDQSPQNYVLVQEGRRYYESVARLDKISRTMIPEKEIVVQGIPTVRIYRIPGRLQARRHADEYAPSP